ncbi:ATP-binding protein [Novosphingobium aquimarinum]|uniref:ATP-binding protein n=1 Tax=Novosphingobium aquimarinum TaxID=2682494 RepID=UPI0012EB6439|nr:ATP-binding protein [Novosphingobium aquimarinum]
MRLLRPHSLMGQMLLAVAGALLLVQSVGALLVYRAQSGRFEGELVSIAAFKIMADTRNPARFDRRAGSRRALQRGRRGLPVIHTPRSPIAGTEERDPDLEGKIALLLREQGLAVAEIQVAHRTVQEDAPALEHVRRRAARYVRLGRKPMSHENDHVLLAAVRLDPGGEWLTARVRTPPRIEMLVWPLLLQTAIIYVVLIGAIALILRRITRPLAALTQRVEAFSATQDPKGQIVPAGPEDMRRLIEAHNAMEGRISALLNEKNVMLGAIGHDLKTPLAALRVRIESVEDDNERDRMAGTIEDIVRTLDDILSLARVGRPSDPLERSELSALVASIVEDYEDMGQPVVLGDTQRIVLELRPTWLRRALRNLIGNAVRYGGEARVSLERVGNRAVIRVADNGPGIPEDRIATMLEPFARGDPSRNSATGGAGLGLALARAIAEQHGGALVLENTRDEASNVTGLVARLELPLS